MAKYSSVFAKLSKGFAMFTFSHAKHNKASAKYSINVTAKYYDTLNVTANAMAQQKLYYTSWCTVSKKQFNFQFES